MSFSLLSNRLPRLCAAIILLGTLSHAHESVASLSKTVSQPVDESLHRNKGKSAKIDFAESHTLERAERSKQQFEVLRRRLLGPGNSTDAANRTDAINRELFETYRLTTGDTIFVYVSPRSDQLSFETTVDIEGNITVPLVGITSVDGKSLQETNQILTQGLSEYLVDPSVQVTLRQQRATQVTVTGEVVHPGLYNLTSHELIAALAEAGGTTDVADLRNIQVRRHQLNQEAVTQSFDLYSALQSGAEVTLPRLIDGDVVLIPELDEDDIQSGEYDVALISSSNIARPEITIRVLDYTGTLTQVKLPNGSYFLDAITQLGADPSNANLKEIALVRFDEVSQEAVSNTYNARDALEGDAENNPSLAHNDVIIIGRSAISRFNYALSTITQPFQDILGFTLFFDSFASGIDSVFGSD